VIDQNSPIPLSLSLNFQRVSSWTIAGGARLLKELPEAKSKMKLLDLMSATGKGNQSYTVEMDWKPPQLGRMEECHSRSSPTLT
jgi:hypothetical protein